MKKPLPIDEHRVAFLRGVLAAFASCGMVVDYDEIRRLCRLNQEMLGTYLGEARKLSKAKNQPDFCSVVVKEAGWPGDGFADATGKTDPVAWAKELRDAHEYWRDRRLLDNDDFRAKHGDVPEVPGLSGGK